MSNYDIAHQLGSKPRTNDVLLPEEENIDFNSMLLPKAILQGLHSSGFVKPSPIQLKAVPLARCGFDLIVQAKSGTGKTCVFAVAALESIILKSNRLQAIILAPTREIAQQINQVISAIGCHMKDLKVHTFIGGTPFHEDKINAANCQIAVGAPGRLKHLIEEKHLLTDAVRLIVLDEADQLMEKSFQNDINFVFQCLPESKQVIACSATYTQDLLNFLGNYMQSATHVTPGQDPSSVLIGLRHLVCIEPPMHNNLSKLKAKEASLLKILKNVSFMQCLVFSNYHSRAENICNLLKRNGWSASWIAGIQKQQTRTAVMTNVKDLKVRILVTTDLTARGIDLHAVNLVINMDIPQEYQTYLHRMGRAGRYGGHGLVITVVTEDEINKFRRLLGAIGGSYASAYVIPDSKPSDNLWSCEIIQLEQIVGIQCDNAVNISDDKNFSDEEGKLRGFEDVVEATDMRDCKNNSNVKVEVEDVNDENSLSKLSNHSFDGQIGSIKDGTGCEDGMKIENNIDFQNALFSDSNDDGIETSKHKSLLSDRHRGDDNNDYDSDDEDDPGKYSGSDSNNSDSDSDNIGSDDVQNSINGNQNEDQTEEDKSVYENEMNKFGLKLLNYSNSYLSNLQSYSNLDKLLNNFIENKCDVEDSNSKKLLEPSGTIDIEYVQKFSRILNKECNDLVNKTRDLDTDMILNLLLTDDTGDLLIKHLDKSMKKESNDDKNTIESNLKIKDPEYYSPSSSSSSEEVVDNNDDKLPSDSDEDESPPFLKTVNLNESQKGEYNRIESTFNKMNVSHINKINTNSCKTNFIKKKEKNYESMEETVNKDVKKTVLFLRKEKGERKRKKVYRSSSLSSNEMKCSSEDVIMEKSDTLNRGILRNVRANNNVDRDIRVEDLANSLEASSEIDRIRKNYFKKYKSSGSESVNGASNKNCTQTLGQINYWSAESNIHGGTSNLCNHSYRTIQDNLFHHSQQNDELSAQPVHNSQQNCDQPAQPVYYLQHQDHQGQSACNFQHSFKQNLQQCPIANTNIHMNNMPKEVQHWYNLWYKQTANFQWYVGYNQYIKHMLNQNK